MERRGRRSVAAKSGRMAVSALVFTLGVAAAAAAAEAAAGSSTEKSAPAAETGATATATARGDQLAATSEEHGDHHEEPNYQYKYAVASRKTGDVKGAWEKRSGDDVWGAYFLRDPDGYWRTVHYEADGTGFYATVQRRPLFARGPGKGKLEPEELSTGKGNHLEHGHDAQLGEEAWEETLAAARESALEENHPALQKGVSLRGLAGQTTAGAEAEPSSDAFYHQIEEAASEKSFSTTGEPEAARRREPGIEDRRSGPPPSSFFSSLYRSDSNEPRGRRGFRDGPSSVRPPSYSSAYAASESGRHEATSSMRPPSYSSAYSASSPTKQGFDNDGPSSMRPPSYSSAYATPNDVAAPTSIRPFPAYSSAYSTTTREPSRFVREGGVPVTGHPSQFGSESFRPTREPQREQGDEQDSPSYSYASSATGESVGEQQAEDEGDAGRTPVAAAYTASSPSTGESIRENNYHNDEASSRPSDDEGPATSANYRVEEPQQQHRDDYHDTNEAYRDEEKGEAGEAGGDDEEEDGGKQHQDDDEGEHDPDQDHERVPGYLQNRPEQEQVHQQYRQHQQSPPFHHAPPPSPYPMQHGYLQQQQQQQQLYPTQLRSPRQPARPDHASAVSEQLLGPAWAEVSHHGNLFESNDWPGFDAVSAQASKEVPTWVKKERAAKARRQQSTAGGKGGKDGERTRWQTTSSPRAPSTRSSPSPPPSPGSQAERPRPLNAPEAVPAPPPHSTYEWSFGTKSKLRGKEDALSPVPVPVPPPKRGGNGAATANNRGPVLFGQPAAQGPSGLPQLEASTPAFDRRSPPKGYVPPSGPAGLSAAGGDKASWLHSKAAPASYSGWVPLPSQQAADGSGVGKVQRAPAAGSQRGAPPRGRESRGQGRGRPQATDHEESRGNAFWKQSWV